MAGTEAFSEDSLDLMRAQYDRSRFDGWGRVAVAGVGMAGLGFALFVLLVPYQAARRELGRRTQELTLERAGSGEVRRERDKLKQLGGPDDPAHAAALQQFQAALPALEATLAQIARAAAGEVVRVGDRILLRLPEAAVFDGRGADLSETGETVLKALAAGLKPLERARALVVAHLDATPVSRDLKDLFPTNWELSAARSTNVVRFLEDEAGVAASHLLAGAGGEHHPASASHMSARRLEVEISPE
jgi:chemotaxis protein MotB